MRVEVRLDAANYNSYEKRHSILLHASYRLTRLHFGREHVNNMHAGPLLLLSIVRDTVWPVNERHLAWRTVNNCVRCRRVRGETLQPKMGNLPLQRITPGLPFLSVGLDFAGPFTIVEAILNSRPLFPLSSSTNDLLSLSPGHFLIGRPLTAPPSQHLGDSKESKLQPYERLEKMQQHFWQRWQPWIAFCPKLDLGEIVLLEDDNAPPLSWKLGRVLRLITGSWAFNLHHLSAKYGTNSNP
ncbi:unnamed protein product [Pieris brassicae]|uniref:DUF5641 domain-containing protein n=1 Tax=Pieris brassicae TaxID=7116 RepID=A0A9P0TJ78_PIEBR|nr:unnamed protein product [Pieris brassicae]